MSLAAKQRLLIAIFAVVAIAMLIAPRISQDPLYHRFADQRGWLGIPNAWNVLSSLIFAWVGIDGLYRMLIRKSLRIDKCIYPGYLVFFTALSLTAAGSAYYHWSPDDASLAVDRLPMAIAFMSFAAILLAERVSSGFARRALVPLLLAAVVSVAYWHYGELRGNGDLRAYLLVQLTPIILLPLVLLAFESHYDREADLWWLLAWYLAAKIFELFDRQIYDLLVVISGHSLKHLAAGLGSLVFLRHLRLRAPAPR
ncbi:MAG: ceramidase domain-containing protein [Gammaproteobacteria bacterium]|jgi:hypothetical protein